VKNVIVRLFACMTGFGCISAHASCANADPSSILDLAHWKLTLPVDGHHGTTGEAIEIQTAELLAGYRSGYFCANPTGGVKFWAPVDGATTNDSEYPRSELRYMLDPDDDNANFSPDTSDAALSARLVVERVPSSTRKVVVGQVHGFQTNAFIKLRYLYDPATNTGSIAALVNEDPDASGSTNYGSIDGLRSGDAFTYSIAFADREITIKINGHVLTSFHVQHGWLHEPMYFKAGAYDQANGSSSTDGGRVTFLSLGAYAHAAGAGGDADEIFSDGLE
jgi:alginate lyase